MILDANTKFGWRFYAVTQLMAWKIVLEVSWLYSHLSEQITLSSVVISLDIEVMSANFLQKAMVIIKSIVINALNCFNTCTHLKWKHSVWPNTLIPYLCFARVSSCFIYIYFILYRWFHIIHVLHAGFEKKFFYPVNVFDPRFMIRSLSSMMKAQQVICE